MNFLYYAACGYKDGGPVSRSYRAELERRIGDLL
jgi:hypothetical protein